MASLRGDKKSLLNAVIEGLKIIKDLPITDKNKGIDGLITFLINERDKFNKNHHEK